MLPRLTIEEWEWDDGNLAELAAHGVSRLTVIRVSEEVPLFRRNKKRRAATLQMIGPDRGGTFWTVCIVEASEWRPGRWRAVTGWRSEPHEIAWYRRIGKGAGNV